MPQMIASLPPKRSAAAAAGFGEAPDAGYPGPAPASRAREKHQWGPPPEAAAARPDPAATAAMAAAATAAETASEAAAAAAAAATEAATAAGRALAAAEWSAASAERAAAGTEAAQDRFDGEEGGACRRQMGLPPGSAAREGEVELARWNRRASDMERGRAWDRALVRSGLSARAASAAIRS
jgi:hypothetical protein